MIVSVPWKCMIVWFPHGVDRQNSSMWLRGWAVAKPILHAGKFDLSIVSASSWLLLLTFYIPWEQRFLSCMSFSIYRVVCMACLLRSWFVFVLWETFAASCLWFTLSMLFRQPQNFSLYFPRGWDLNWMVKKTATQSLEIVHCWAISFLVREMSNHNIPSSIFQKSIVFLKVWQSFMPGMSSIKINWWCIIFQTMVFRFGWAKQKWKFIRDWKRLLQALLSSAPHGSLAGSRVGRFAHHGELASRLLLRFVVFFLNGSKK